MTPRALLVRCLGCLLALGCTSCARYTCGVPKEDGKCRPLSAVYSALTGESDTLSYSPPAAADAAESAYTADALDTNHSQPMLARPRQLRVWMPSWVDAEGDLRGEGYLYLRLDEGRWLLEP